MCPRRLVSNERPRQSTSLDLDVQYASALPDVPTEVQFRHWVEAALAGRRERAALSVRLVGGDEGAELNGRFRGRRGPTNVLSFPFESPPGFPESDLLGDLVICAPVVAREAREQGKRLQAHWAHMLVHGVLHLLGYDHLDAEEAARMEEQETRILSELGFPDPYQAT
jgi:probable rRNA maturation factor